MIKVNNVDKYISAQPQWADKIILIRKVLLSLDLEETIKWGGPVYMYKRKNIVGLGGFKSFISLWYYQGALLKDENKLLVNAQEGVTKAMRQMRFRVEDSINPDVITAYTLESIENHKQGLEIKADTQKPLIIPPELETYLAENSELFNSFEQLGLAKRREYAEFISSAKRPETKIKRLEKIQAMILRGIGLTDKYRR